MGLAVAFGGGGGIAFGADAAELAAGGAPEAAGSVVTLDEGAGSTSIGGAPEVLAPSAPRASLLAAGAVC